MKITYQTCQSQSQLFLSKLKRSVISTLRALAKTKTAGIVDRSIKVSIAIIKVIPFIA